MQFTLLDDLRLAREFDQRMAYAMRDLSRRSGPVATYGYGPLKTTFLFGPEANEFIFRNSSIFRWRGGFETLIPLAGETALLVSDGPGHDRRRTLVQPAFQREPVTGYLGVLLDKLDTTLDSWRPGDRIDLYRIFRSLVRSSTIRGFFGPELAAHHVSLGADLEVVLHLLNYSLPKQQLLQTVPNPFWRRAKAALARIDRRVRAEITRRRNADDPGDGVLGLLMSTHGDGLAMTDTELRDMVVSLIVASYDTTSAALSWAVYALWSDRRAWARARSEVREGLGARTPELGLLRGLPYLDWVTSETLRLYPPAMAGARKADEDFTFAGHRGRAGDLVVFSQYVTHRLPRIWADPDRFWPERWDRERPGYRHPSSYEYLPFGVGARRCLGSNLARAEIAAVLARLLQRTDLTLLSRDVQPTGFTAMFPRGGVTVRVDHVRAPLPVG
ncbi:cytochrome P450 [Actinomadura alba]|uniref:Cytochrome P450 n=1 Tax=Actinomadura alba TaxID=406431 RepID=A0ABR7LUJ6_9ACTN|nr:cytochrome P450 [Actinomadura alba]MBC6468348.1 cytochrome P450 [Actinomadura alba]